MDTPPQVDLKPGTAGAPAKPVPDYSLEVLGKAVQASAEVLCKELGLDGLILIAAKRRGPQQGDCFSVIHANPSAGLTFLGNFAVIQRELQVELAKAVGTLSPRKP